MFSTGLSQGGASLPTVTFSGLDCVSYNWPPSVWDSKKLHKNYNLLIVEELHIINICQQVTGLHPISRRIQLATAVCFKLCLPDIKNSTRCLGADRLAEWEDWISIGLVSSSLTQRELASMFVCLIHSISLKI